jgi:hypothetical protein
MTHYRNYAGKDSLPPLDHHQQGSRNFDPTLSQVEVTQGDEILSSSEHG